jgi:tetratricopeptide (TPR) repeat protein
VIRHPTAAQIARWVKQLGDEDFEVRELASRNLRLAGEAAEAQLSKAARSGDLEISRRARDILSDFKWGLYPETPRKIADLVREYRSSSRGEKGAVIKKLYEAGPAGCRALIKIATAEDDLQTRREVFGPIARDLPRRLKGLLDDNRLDAVEALLKLGVASEDRRGNTNYAAYALLSGHLDRRIADWEALARRHPTGKPQAEVLFYLYRARGDLKAALKAAKQAERLDLEEAALYESADWRALSARAEQIGSPNRIEKIGQQAAYARLTGDKKGLATALARLRELGGGPPRRPGPPPHATALFLNDQIAAGLESLDNEENRKLRFEVLVARADIAGAFAMVEKARKEKRADLPLLEVLQARTLIQLGEKDKGLAIFKRYAEPAKNGPEGPWADELIESCGRAGLRDLAFEYAARMLAGTKDRSLPHRLIPKLFAANKDDAALLWALLSGAPTPAAPDKRLAQLRALLDGKAGEKELSALVKLVENQEKSAPGQMGRLWVAVAEAALACKQEAIAVSCLKRSNTVTANIRHGDLLASKKDWARAAERYTAAYQRTLDVSRLTEGTTEAAPETALFLCGWALAQSGKSAEGKKLMELAHWLPLGDARARYEFARALEKRKHVADARRAWDLLRRVGEATLTETESFYTGEGLLMAGVSAYRAKDYFKAADAYEQAMLRSLRPDVHFVNPAAYVGVPSATHRTRGLGLLAAGKLDEAVREAELALAALPGSTDVATRFVPELDRRGRKKEATALYERALAVQEKLCRDYPRYAPAHNSVAWVSVVCGRNLDKALVHARKAVEMAPKNAAYHDTLAEVLFQKGMKKEAIAAQKKAVELMPARAYFRKQLKRIEAGDPKAPRSAEEE